ncbi:MAG: hypothetical protein KJ737_01970 [Proteobacteria bacterium]|nr:hypothetical protein [Pseudomonadota bacterium]
MIAADTVKFLNLKSYTMNACTDMYRKFISEYPGPDAIRELLGWWRDNPEKLNEAWWTLNYHSKNLDPDRMLRANVERMLDDLVMAKHTHLIVEI